MSGIAPLKSALFVAVIAAPTVACGDEVEEDGDPDTRLCWSPETAAWRRTGRPSWPTARSARRRSNAIRAAISGSTSDWSEAAARANVPATASLAGTIKAPPRSSLARNAIPRSRRAAAGRPGSARNQARERSALSTRRVRPRPAVPDARNIETFLALASSVDLSADCGPVSPMTATPAPARGERWEARRRPAGPWPSR